MSSTSGLRRARETRADEGEEEEEEVVVEVEMVQQLKPRHGSARGMHVLYPTTHVLANPSAALVIRGACRGHSFSRHHLPLSLTYKVSNYNCQWWSMYLESPRQLPVRLCCRRASIPRPIDTSIARPISALYYARPGCRDVFIRQPGEGPCTALILVAAGRSPTLLNGFTSRCGINSERLHPSM